MQFEAIHTPAITPLGGRDNGSHAHDQYARLQTIRVDLAGVANEVVT